MKRLHQVRHRSGSRSDSGSSGVNPAFFKPRCHLSGVSSSSSGETQCSGSDADKSPGVGGYTPETHSDSEPEEVGGGISSSSGTGSKRVDGKRKVLRRKGSKGTKSPARVRVKVGEGVVNFNKGAGNKGRISNVSSQLGKNFGLLDSNNW